MIIHNCIQGSLEWHQARAGKITASMAKEIKARLKTGKNKGEYNQKAKDYAFRLAIERISGEWLEEDGFNPWQAKRGNELEAEVRAAHEIEKGIFIEQAGFITSDCGNYGVSVDGFIDDYGITEYKCFLAPSKLRPILIDNDIETARDQVQTGLWLTKREYGEFALYCPALKSIGKDLKIIEFAREPDYIEEIEEAFAEFNKFVESEMHLLREAA